MSFADKGKGGVLSRENSVDSLMGEKLRKQNSFFFGEEKRAENRPVWLEPRVFSCTFPAEVRISRSVFSVVKFVLSLRGM